MGWQQRRLTVLCFVAAQRRVGWPPHSTYNVCRAPNPSMMSPRKQDLAWANASPVPAPRLYAHGLARSFCMIPKP